MGNVLEAILELAQGQGQRRIDLAVDRDLPRVRVRGQLGDLAIVADVVDLGWRHVVVEQVCWSLGDQRLVANHDELRRLAGEVELRFLGERHRYVAFGHEAAEWDGSADGGAHGGEASALEQAPPAYAVGPHAIVI